MNPQTLEQEITQTLEQCLSKMSEILKTDFNPHDKTSIQLLQQFRSTISTYHNWLKKTVQFAGGQHAQSKQHAKPPQKQQTSPKDQADRLSFLKQSVKDKKNEITRMQKEQKYSPKKPPATPGTQPSGLLYKPG